MQATISCHRSQVVKATKHPLLVWGDSKLSRGGRARKSRVHAQCQLTGTNRKDGFVAKIGTAAAGALVSLVMVCLPAAADQGTEDVFAFKCAGCHANGGNIFGGPTLQLGDLEKNGLLDTDAMYKIIYSGKAKMPGFGSECAPKGQCTFGKRFTDEQVIDMANFVLQKADGGW